MKYGPERKVVDATRWVFVPVTCVLAWYAALIITIWVIASIFPSIVALYLGVALAAVLVVTAGFFTAPAGRKAVGWLVFVIGSGAALVMGEGEFGICSFTIAAGWATTFLLTRSHWVERVE